MLGHIEDLCEYPYRARLGASRLIIWITLVRLVALIVSHRLLALFVLCRLFVSVVSDSFIVCLLVFVNSRRLSSLTVERLRPLGVECGD